MTKWLFSLVAGLAVMAILSPDVMAQCRGGGQQGSRMNSQSFGGSQQNGNFNQASQYNQQAALQQAAIQQLQLQRAMLQQQYALRKAQEREKSRQQRLAAANARREKDAKRRTDSQSTGSLTALAKNQ